ncbi:Protein CBG19299 [Caenorhabditis briggsae]|uniref:Protein CBG19299 n=1 Tax=Caenorhabditis briggsae TaxID=6238 RepID=A8XVA7_CAEBR|nr:Protein CBG19299 [Caenorhabditis briggsae]CAP36574.2 Protein CBG19299 [Caenorhabditis briggsae]
MEPVLQPWDDSQTIAKSKITSRASIRIFEKYPLKEENVSTLFSTEEMAGGEPEELYKLVVYLIKFENQSFFIQCRQLLNVWKYAIFFQPKPENFANLLQESNYPAPVIKGILEAYSSETFTELVESLASCSNSNIPRVISTDWTCRAVARQNNIAFSDREATLTLSTDKGVKQVNLSAKELEKLYWTVSKVQESLDGLLER